MDDRDIKIDFHMDSQTDRQIDGWMDKRTIRPIDRQTSRLMNGGVRTGKQGRLTGRQIWAEVNPSAG